MFEPWYTKKSFIFKIWWQKHFTKLINQENFYKDFVPFFEKEIDNNLDKVVSDFILMLLIVLYFEIPFVYGYHFQNQEYVQKKQKSKKDRNRMIERLQKNINEIDEYRSYIYKNQQNQEYKYNDEAHFHTEKMISEYKRSVTNILKNLRESSHLAKEVVYTKDINFLYSREIDSLIGIRNMSMRYIVLCMQLAELYTPNRNFYKFIYTFLYKITPRKYRELISILSVDDIPKYIKHIDVNDPNQPYNATLRGCQEYHEHELIHQRILFWYYNDLSYDKLNKFQIKWGF